MQTFLVVCRCLSFTEAARLLSMSQPAVSRQIAVLEDELGTPLFNRDHNAISLSAAGVYLSRELEPIWERLQVVLKKTSHIGSGVVGWLSIGLLEDQLLDGVISHALRVLKQQDVHLDIQRYNFRELEEALANNSIDVAISIEQAPDVFRSYERMAYAEECMCLAVNLDAIPQGVPFNEMQIVSNCPLLYPNMDVFPKYQHSMLTGLIKGSLVLGDTYDFSSIAPMVSAGLATTVVNETHCLSMDDRVVLYPMETIPKVKKGVFWSRFNHNPVIARFIDVIRSFPTG